MSPPLLLHDVIGDSRLIDWAVKRPFNPIFGQRTGYKELDALLARLGRDVMLGLKTCRKLGLSFFTYLGDRLGLDPDQPKIPPLAILVARTV